MENSAVGALEVEGDYVFCLDHVTTPELHCRWGRKSFTVQFGRDQDTPAMPEQCGSFLHIANFLTVNIEVRVISLHVLGVLMHEL